MYVLYSEARKVVEEKGSQTFDYKLSKQNVDPTAFSEVHVRRAE
jgi:hypothetical protein